MVYKTISIQYIHIYLHLTKTMTPALECKIDRESKRDSEKENNMAAAVFACFDTEFVPVSPLIPLLPPETVCNSSGALICFKLKILKIL